MAQPILPQPSGSQTLQYVSFRVGIFKLSHHPENRLTAYTWKKTWADPWGRIKILVVLALLAGFIAYTIFDELAI